MAYAAVLSLKRTLSRFLDCSLIETDPAHSKIIRSAYENEVDSLKDLVLRLDNSERMNILSGQITEAAWKLQDTLESLVLNQFFSQSEISGDEEGRSLKLSVYLDEEAKQGIASFIEMVKKLREVYGEGELKSSNPLSEEVVVVSSRTDYGAISSKMVGLSDQYIEIKELVVDSGIPFPLIIPLLGMAGIGKSTIAKKIFEDASALGYFQCCAFVTLGQTYQLKEVILRILAQMEHKVDEIQTQREEELADYLYKSFQGRKYLIVLDDVWNENYMDDFERILPNDGCVGRIIVTTRLAKVASSSKFNTFNPTQIRFLNKEESWELLREKLFVENNSCPYELEKAGKKIAEVCEGLPLTIITIARLLSEAPDKTPEYWNEVAEKRSSVFIDAYDEMYEVLYPSYTYLHQDLQGCFLYMGVFPLSFRIPASKLYNLWEAEDVHEGYLHNKLGELVANSIVLVNKKGSNEYRIKTCYLHSVFLHLCVKEAEKIKFFRIINGNISKQSTESERRLCIQNIVLFGIEEVSEWMKSRQMVRSILCTGEYHRYPIQICLANWRLLKVVNALTIRFYEFPMEVLKLFHLTYLAVTCNKDLPASIFKLYHLEYLIVHRYMNIKSCEAHSYLPMNIWRMKNLKHLEVIGCDLPEPDPSCGDHVLLPNLLRLFGVSTHSCTRSILSRIPNLEKLGIKIEYGPDDCQPLSCFDHLSGLRILESLKCVIVNHGLMSCPIVPFPNSATTFPSLLTKLSLSGMSYPWEHMRMIGQMPYLRALKLRYYAFRGPTWKINDGEFKTLQYLLIEDTDLEYLMADDDECFKELNQLIIRHCYKLNDIPSRISKHKPFPMIELVDCPLAVALVKKLQVNYVTVWIHSSWDEASTKVVINRGQVS